MTTKINAQTCTRCLGSGSYSYNLKDGTVCYGCGGTGYQIVAPKGQKKMKPTVNHENKAKIGDIIELNCILYRIEAIRWVKKQWHKGRQVNQQMTLNRLVDGKTAYLPRGIVGTDGWIIETPEELIGVDVK